MERNGDVIAELNRCNTPICSLLNNSYHSDKYKMCKDDIVTPLFCSASDCLSKSMIMGSEHKSAERFLNSDDEKINLFNTRRDYISNDDFNMPVIESSVDSIQDCCDSPIWEKPPILQSFSPIKVENFKPKNSFINGSKLNVTENSVDLCNTTTENSIDLHKNVSLSNAENSHVSVNDINSKLLLDYEAETSSSSSTEELESCPELKDAQLENNSTSNEASELDSNHNIKNSINQDFDGSNLPPSPFAPELPEIKKSDSNLNSPTKIDPSMPELIPSLICLDDDDDESSVLENKKEQYEIINVADSPEMPTLIPFTSERDEVFQVKTECISEDEIAKDDDTDTRDTADEIFQPQVLLQRLSVNSVSKEDEKNVFSAYLENCYKTVIEGPEIEEIEGVRFFQFRSKREMEEFNRNTTKIEADEDMIVPTKTTDITQIKGWRTKFFAPESQFQLQSLIFDDVKKDSNQEEKVTANHLNETENKNNEKKELRSEAPTSETKKSPTSMKCSAEESCEEKNDHCDDSSSDSEEDEKKTRFKEVKDEGNKNPLSAFVSEELDKYLLNSSALNISLLQQVNPNIIPIPKDAKILSIGKLRKTDDPPLPPHLVFKRKSDSFKVEKLENESVESVITLDDDSPQSPNIITLESSEESDEDIPVATLKSKKKVVIKRENSKGFKRNLESEYETSAKRVVLRLTKEGSGVSKGYKVSDISCKNEKSGSTSRASSPSSGASSLDFSQDIEIPTNGSLPIIKKTLFTEKNEKRLVNEFLNNLNMYGTRKDVAMLVQSNQSYFDEGPTLTSKICAKAVSVLVSNKEYFEEKQKSKKKLKTWQKYLPKKIDKQNMKMKFSKRKSRIEKLLDDAESMIPAERGKRSIRLPARYLDSAVLAASEWVSPVINVDDYAPIKCKQEPVEDSVKNKTNEDTVIVLSPPSSTESSSPSSSSSEDIIDKEPVKLPQKRSVKMKKTLVKKKKLKDNSSKHPVKLDAKKSVNRTNSTQPSKIKSSSSDSSDEDIAEVVDNKVVSKKVPNKKKKSEVLSTKNSNSISKTAGKSLADEVAMNKHHKSEELCAKAKKMDVIPPPPSPKSSSKLTDSVNSSKITENITVTPSGKSAQFYPRAYLMPNCSCKHSARTALFEYYSKQFICAFCSSMKKLVFPANSKKNEINSVNVQSKEDEKDESCASIKNKIEELQSHLVSINGSRKSDSIKLANEKPEEPDLAEAEKNNLNISDISTSIPINFTNQFLKQDSKLKTVNASPNVPSNNKYFLLLQPVKTAANSNVPVLPVRHDIASPKTNQSPKPASHHSSSTPNSLFLTNKSKPPILIRKTSTGFAAQNMSNESSNYNVLASNNKDKSCYTLTTPNSKLISNSSSSPVSSPLVTAYKVGGNYFICNSVVSPDAKTVIPSSAVSSGQAKPIEGPIITSVQSVKVDEKSSDDTSFQNENTESSEILNTSISNLHNYHKKQRQNRRKSPLIQLNYTDKYDQKDAEENMEVDVETVDESCNTLVSKKTVKVDESDSDISDNECASIFLSSTDKLRSVYSKKTIKERQRRLQIKSGFETLKVSSRWFKNARTCKEILDMAIYAIDVHKKADKMYNLAKKRLKIHNSMLMGKLSRLIEGIEPENAKNKIKMQIIKALAFNQDKYRNKKSLLPLLPEEKEHKGSAFSSDTERKKTKLDAPDIEIVVENARDVSSPPVIESKTQAISPQLPVEEKNIPRVPTPQPSITEVKSVAEEVKNAEKTVENCEEPDDALSVQAVSLDEVLDLDTKATPDDTKKEDEIHEILLESPPKDTQNVSQNDSSKTKFEGLKQKVKEALGKNDKEESSDSDTEELGSDSFNMSGFSDEEIDLKFCSGDKKENSLNNKSSTDEISDKTPVKEYPGLIPLFHPKVLKKNVSPSQSPLPPKIVGESSQRTNTSSKTVPEEIQLDDDDSDDDEVAILNNPTIPSSMSSKWGNPSSSKEEVELAVATKTANKLFGPCTVQKVHLKDGKTVFAYHKETVPSEAESSNSGAKSVSTNKSPALQTNGVRTLKDIFNAVKTKKRVCNRKKLNVPLEIVLSDSSDDETESKSDNAPRTSQDSSSSKPVAHGENDIDEQNIGDKSDSPNSSL